MIRRTLILVGPLVLLAVPASAQADFGIEEGSLKFVFEDSAGRTVTQAGSHPHAFNLVIELNAEPGGVTEGREFRGTVTDLPPGRFGNPRVVVRIVLPKTEAVGPVYNLTLPGVTVPLGFTAVGFTAIFAKKRRRPKRKKSGKSRAKRGGAK